MQSGFHDFLNTKKNNYSILKCDFGKGKKKIVEI